MPVLYLVIQEGVLSRKFPRTALSKSSLSVYNSVSIVVEESESFSLYFEIKIIISIISIIL